MKGRCVKVMKSRSNTTILTRIFPILIFMRLFRLMSRVGEQATGVLFRYGLMKYPFYALLIFLAVYAFIWYKQRYEEMQLHSIEAAAGNAPFAKIGGTYPSSGERRITKRMLFKEIAVYITAYLFAGFFVLIEEVTGAVAVICIDLGITAVTALILALLIRGYKRRCVAYENRSDAEREAERLEDERLTGKARARYTPYGREYYASESMERREAPQEIRVRKKYPAAFTTHVAPFVMALGVLCMLALALAGVGVTPLSSFAYTYFLIVAGGGSAAFICIGIVRVVRARNADEPSAREISLNRNLLIEELVIFGALAVAAAVNCLLCGAFGAQQVLSVAIIEMIALSVCFALFSLLYYIERRDCAVNG